MAIDNAGSKLPRCAFKHSLTLSFEQAAAMKRSMEQLVLDRRALFGDDYTVEDVFVDLETFSTEMMQQLRDINKIQRYHELKQSNNENDQEQASAMYEELTSSFRQARQNVVPANVRAFAGSGKGRESALARAQNDWCVASEKLLLLKPKHQRGTEKGGDSQYRELQVVRSDKPTNADGSVHPDASFMGFEQVANDYKSDDNHAAKRFYVRMNRIVQKAKDKGATSVEHACEQQRDTCEGTAQAIWGMAKRPNAKFPALVPKSADSDKYAESDKDVVCAMTPLAAFNAMAAFYDL